MKKTIPRRLWTAPCTANHQQTQAPDSSRTRAPPISNPTPYPLLYGLNLTNLLNTTEENSDIFYLGGELGQIFLGSQKTSKTETLKR